MQKTLVVLVGFLFTSLAAAQPNYSNVQLALTQYSAAEDSTGLSLLGSMDLNKQLVGFGSYSMVEGDETFLGTKVEWEYSFLKAGLGFKHPLQLNLDLVPSFALIRAEAEVNGFSEDDIGYELGLAVVAAPRKEFELTGGLAHTDVFNNTDLVLFGGGTYYLAPNLGIAGRLEMGDADIISIGGRMNF